MSAFNRNANAASDTDVYTLPQLKPKRTLAVNSRRAKNESLRRLYRVAKEKSGKVL